ncbi:hypothetical protein CCU22_00130 [Candidatus Legionella polyplacis]|uniref:enhanced entry protein EnhB n=1 Tax=Candidatus Legionella polyplacis TaxID=2005262 RepID=UPI000C1F5D84|nr:enhanced entry protein EnhB [Candidatus Legionella polyplacis]ATW01647.1 hypothetical protein CCU22_00130 [Candidatus Legionella polyplacis]
MINHKFILFTLNILLTSISIAQTIFPNGCKKNGFYFNNKNLFINISGKQSLYLFYNYSKFPIKLTQNKEQKKIINFFLIVTTILDSMHWSAFSLDTKNFCFECFIKKNNIFHKIKCINVLYICQYTNVKFTSSNYGTYWVSSNKKLENIIKETINKGIYLHW